MSSSNRHLNSRGGASEAHDERAAPAALSLIPATSHRDTISWADELPAKQHRSSGAELQLEKEH